MTKVLINNWPHNIYREFTYYKYHRALKKSRLRLFFCVCIWWEIIINIGVEGLQVYGISPSRLLVRRTGCNAIRLWLRTWRISSLTSCISAIISSTTSTTRWRLLSCRCLGIRYASICFWIALNIATIFWTAGFYSGISSSRFCLGSFFLFFFGQDFNLFLEFWD